MATATAPPPPGTKTKGGLKSIPKWVWIVAGLVAVGAFIYFKRSASSTSANTGVPPQGSGTGVDESQLSSDIAAQLAAALGGTPDQGGAVSSPDQSQLDQDLLSLIQQSQGDYDSLVTSLLSGGIIQPTVPGATTPGTTPSGVGSTGGFPSATVPGDSSYYAPPIPGTSPAQYVDPYNPYASPFAVQAAPNTAGIAGVVNPGAAIPQVFSTSGQNLTGFVPGQANPTPSRTGPARAF